MLGKEIIGTLKDKRAVIFIIIILSIMLIDLVMGYFQHDVAYIRQNEGHIKALDAKMQAFDKEDEHWVSIWLEHPAFVSFLSGTTHGHLPQMLLIWLLPLYILNLYSDRYISEYNRGYVNVMFMRTGRLRYILTKMVSSFIIPFTVMLGCLLINFGLAHIIYMGGYTFHGLECVTGIKALEFMTSHGNLTYCIYMLFTSFAAGCCGVICQCIAMLVKKYAHTYIAGFLVWMALVISNARFTVISLIQPFTADETDEAVPPLILLTVLTLSVMFITVMIKRKRDEL